MRLTEDLARDIVKIVEIFPDMEVDVTWKNVESQVYLKFGEKFTWRTLSRKEWNGRFLIQEAFETAKKVERQLKTQLRRRSNVNMPRQRLLTKVEELAAKLAAAKIELEQVRVLQYDQLDIFRVTRFDLRREAEQICGKR